MPLRTITKRVSVAGAVVSIGVLLIYVGAATASAATSTPTPAATAIKPDPTLPIVFLVASIIVIAAALFFAWRYHKLLIAFMEKALGQGQVFEPSSTPALRNLLTAKTTAFTHAIVGTSSTTPGQELVFAIRPTLNSANGKPAVVAWSIDDKPVQGFTDCSFTYTFKIPGEFKVKAESDGAAVSPFTVAVKEAASSARPTLPFAIENWGRLIIVLFGLGVVGALMAIGVLSTDAGAGLLGAMLGIGAATAATGSGKEKASNGDTPAPNSDKK